jgi:hypothetical protein
MSQAFVREGDDQWLEDIAPTMAALANFLRRENNGVAVHEQRVTTDPTGRTIHHMSNGLRYARNTKGKWEVVE